MNYRLSLGAFIVFCFFLLPGCATSSPVIVGKVRPPTSPDQVKIYLKPPTKYEEVAMLDSPSANSWAVTAQRKMNKAVKRLKEEAAKLGANGVLQREADEYRASVSTGSGFVASYGPRHSETTVGYGTGVAVPILYKAASWLAIYVIEE